MSEKMLWPDSVIGKGEPSQKKIAELLVVEDSDDLRTSTADLLRMHGYTTHEASNVTNAVNKAYEIEGPLIALVDLGLQNNKLGGLEIISRLQGRRHPTEYIIVTGLDDVGIRAIANDAGVLSYHIKTRSNELLLSEVRKCERVITAVINSDFDYLTGVPNRRSCEKAIKKAFEQAEGRHEFNISLVFIDVNNLKKINDTYGHRAGDKALQAVANRIRGIDSLKLKCLRKSDEVYRWAGDAFVIPLMHMGKTQAHRIKSCIRQGMIDLVVHVEEGTSITVTFSVGVSSAFSGIHRNAPECIDRLIKRAEEMSNRQKAKQKTGRV